MFVKFFRIQKIDEATITVLVCETALATVCEASFY